MRTFAYYLSQYHEIPENDLWWGKGFTEWTNVKKAARLFPDHQQPRVPELGYYDLIEDPDAIKKQAALAKSFGLEGWTFYYYHFSAGKRLLEKPVENFLKSQSIDIGFNLMWANETWSRRWNGEEQDILIEQMYDNELIEALAHDVARHFSDPRYTRINGKPLFLIYRPSGVKDCANVIQRLRAIWKSSYGTEVYLSGGLTRNEKDPRQYGFDSAYEFPPHQIPYHCKMDTSVLNLKPEFKGTVWDYFKVTLNEVGKKCTELITHPCVTLRWDNTARVNTRATMMQNFNYVYFFDWCNHAMLRARSLKNTEEQLCFVNAWNEWAEGAYLESDETDGCAALHVLRASIEQLSWSQMMERVDDSKVKELLLKHEKIANIAKTKTLVHLEDQKCDSCAIFEKELELSKTKIATLKTRIDKLVSEKSSSKQKIQQLKLSNKEIYDLWTTKAVKPLIKLEKKLRNKHPENR